MKWFLLYYTNPACGFHSLKSTVFNPLMSPLKGHTYLNKPVALAGDKCWRVLESSNKNENISMKWVK